MEKLKKCFAFERAVKAFGPWNTWSRWEHLAYGLVRGIPYHLMERHSNDAIMYFNITEALVALGAWSDLDPVTGWKAKNFAERKALSDQVVPLATWIRKPVRVKRVRPSEEAAE